MGLTRRDLRITIQTCQEDVVRLPGGRRAAPETAQAGDVMERTWSWGLLWNHRKIPEGLRRALARSSAQGDHPRECHARRRFGTAEAFGGFAPIAAVPGPTRADGGLSV
ncbi:hypothetical protein FMEAI12_2490015 [Parafrankia sp. Ea1.12]|nr:hypothetical protein FMEAI12_2490015 [Parafrankia sp. Ea1.12]